jgi:UDP-N-acetylglucosamine 2-epimerase (non-hydrolysing)
MKIAILFGTRPEIIKLYSVINYCEENKLDFITIHTNQHYDYKMDKIFFEQLGLKDPDYNLNIGSGSHAKMTGNMLIKIEEVLISEKIDLVFVQGDTNTVLAGGIVASKLNIKLAHIEAGLRSYDRSMPEEINRIVVDHVSDYLFPPTLKQEMVLLNEGINKSKIKVVGNTIVDVVDKFKGNINEKSSIIKQLNLQNDNFILLTCHRPSNTDNDKNFLEILKGVDQICKKYNLICIFPMHPRLSTKVRLIENFSSIKVIEPVGFFDSLALQIHSNIILTDSGGIQEESCILQKKCIILRQNTERPETLQGGGALLCQEITSEIILNNYNSLKGITNSWDNPFGDGFSYKYIFEFINKK